MQQITVADKRFDGFREEMSMFRLDLKEYYGYFVTQCAEIVTIIEKNQNFNNSEYAEV